MIYQRWKAEHRCVDCGQIDDRTLSGRVRCANCTAKIRERLRQRASQNPEEYAADLQSRKAYYQRLKAHRLCTRCGQSDERTQSGYSLCADCAAKDRARYARRKGAAQ